jgi:glycosyltransferase involved in cell wall biosynthesis
MKIAQISTALRSTPPAKYGAVEALVSYLTEELVAQGHEVTLFATGDSVTKARLWSLNDAPESCDASHPSAKMMNELAGAVRLVDACHYIAQSRFDIVHNHHALGPHVLDLLHTPALTTAHTLPASYRIFPKNHPLVSITLRQQELEPGLNWIDNVYYGLRLEDFPFKAAKDDYLLFIGAIAPRKGTHTAIHVARELRMRLKIAGPIADPTYYARLASLIDGELIEYVGEADFAQKTALYKHASALLFPIAWEEPFGLVLIEALACGTPVIAFARGSVPEIIVDGEVGFAVNTLEEMIASVEKVRNISPQQCRDYIASRFDVRIMARRYLHIYERLCVKSESRT